jgi:hypothetical protein
MNRPSPSWLPITVLISFQSASLYKRFLLRLASGRT